MALMGPAEIDAASPLEDAGILLHVLNILGPGQHLLISLVSKSWRDSYQRVGSVQMAGTLERYDNEPSLHTITSGTTLCSAIFSTAASTRLAYECGLNFDDESVHRLAGRHADLVALHAAQELGLQLTGSVLIGAAEGSSESVLKLQWLHIDQRCELPSSICYWAARRGSIHTLRWLREHGSVFDASTCEGAAAGAHMQVLQFLRAEGREWNVYACRAAATNGHLTTL
eukprot:4248-Heterococcus_DN1.PRE.2